jgi:hypothetical protein
MKLRFLSLGSAGPFRGHGGLSPNSHKRGVARLGPLFLLTALTVQAQTTLTGLKFRVEPESRKILPGETAVIQVLSYGEIKDNQSEQKGRLRKADWNIRIVERDGGWLSKRFAFQGQEREAFLEERKDSLAARILTRGAAEFVVKDSVLYVAPLTPGRFTVEASQGSVVETVQIEVAAGAPSQVKPEVHQFGPEPPGNDPYRPLAEYYAPLVAQEVWFQPKSDYLARFDFDGDWHGDNNWDNLDEGSSQAYVYYAAMETASHWFLTYNFFHARDYSDRCVAGTCHENDNEGIFLTIRKDATPFGTLEVMETLAHNNVYSYTNDPAIRPGAHNIDGPLALWEGKHPIVFLEAGGHGALGGGDKKSLFFPSRMTFQNLGVTYIYKGIAERPKFACDRNVGYELLPILEHWWPKSQMGAAWSGRTFDDFFDYTPFGNRPAPKNRRVSGAFLGRKHSANKARPFWGWSDLRTRNRKILATGQWGLDPAYAVSRNLTFPPGRRVSLDYVYNPYLDIDLRGAAAAEAPAQTAGAAGAPPAPAPPAAPVRTEGWCEIRALVDATVAVLIRAGQASFETRSGQPVAQTEFRCDAPVPDAVVSLTLDKQAGRGNARVVEPGAPGNQFTTRIEIDDPQRGADRYRLLLRWRLAGR